MDWIRISHKPSDFTSFVIFCNRINRIGWRENVPETVYLWRSTMASCNLFPEIDPLILTKATNAPGFLLEFCHHHGQFRRQCVQIRQSPVHLFWTVAISGAQIGGTLWWTNILLWKITIFNGKIHYKWPFSIAMLVHQRVCKGNIPPGSMVSCGTVPPV